MDGCITCNPLYVTWKCRNIIHFRVIF